VGKDDPQRLRDKDNRQVQIVKKKKYDPELAKEGEILPWCVQEPSCMNKKENGKEVEKTSTGGQIRKKRGSNLSEK